MQINRVNKNVERQTSRPKVPPLNGFPKSDSAYRLTKVDSSYKTDSVKENINGQLLPPASQQIIRYTEAHRV